MRDRDQANGSTDKSRRTFLLLVPLAAIGGIFATVASAAFRFLRPVVSASSQNWIDVARVAEISGNQPIARKVVAEQVSGWAKSLVEHSVYVLPGKNNQVLSAVCPHEGCEVFWRGDENVFSCPCHDSSFGPDGSRIYGPAPRGLDPLPSRVQDDKVQVQYQEFVNDTPARTRRT
jgi:menaquinol-cytochrome c reductase iron-sulfur subunit